MPFDFTPIIGHLDDAIIVPGLILLALEKVPVEVVDECRAAVQTSRDSPLPPSDENEKAAQTDRREED